jgi:hypothetical protein
LEIAREDLNDKERLLRTRDSLLETSGLETKRLTDALEKEKQARRADRQAWDLMQRNQQSLTRTIQQNDSRVGEIETARQADRRRYQHLEQSLKNQLADRNALLGSLLNRLSSLICGPDFNQRNRTNEISYDNDAMAKSWAQFNRNIDTAMEAVEKTLSSVKTQVRDFERGLTKDFTNLERALEIRTKRIDQLEQFMSTARHASDQQGRTSSSSTRDDQYARLRSENKVLKAEIQSFRTASNPNGSNNSQSPIPARASSTRDRGRRETSLMRHFSGSPSHSHEEERGTTSPVLMDPTVTVPGAHPPRAAAESPRRQPSLHHTGSLHTRNASGGSASLEPSEQRWVHRLKELERRLKGEREARLLDRSGARKRIEEAEGEREELRLAFEKERNLRMSLEEEQALVMPDVE